MILFSSIFPKGLLLKLLQIGKNLVKFVKLKSKLLYDTQESIDYNTPNVTITYNKTTLSSSGETVSPSVNASQSWNRIGYSGTYYKQNNLTNYTAKYSIEQDNDGFTLDINTGKVKCSNNTTTSPRIFKINVEITMNDSDDKITKFIEFTQSAGTEKIEYTIWDTTGIQLTASDTSVDAKLNYVYLTTKAEQVRYKKRYMNGVLIENTPEYLTIEVTPSYSITGDGFSINNNVVTVQSRGINPGNIRTGVVTASYDGKTDSVTINLSANLVEKIIYGVPTVSLGYNPKDASKGSVNPNISYSQTRTEIYTSEESKSISDLTSGATIIYAEVSANSGASVDISTGIITWKANTTTSSRNYEVSVLVSLNNKISTKNAIATLLADAKTTITYGIPVITFSYGNIIDAKEQSVTPSISYVLSRTQNWVSGNTTALSNISANIDDEYTDYDYASYDGETDYVTINNSTGVIKWKANTDSNNNRSVNVTATVTRNGKTATASAIASQSKDAKTTITYGDLIFSKFEYSVKNANEGTVTPSIAYTQSRTQNWVSGDTTVLSDLSSSTDDDYITYKEKTDISGVLVNVNSGVITWTDNTSTTKERSVVITATVSRNNKTSTIEATATQTKDELINTTISYGIPSITSITLNKDIPAVGGTTDSSYFTVYYSQVKTITNHYISGDVSSLESLSGVATKVTMKTNVTGSNLTTNDTDRTKIGTAKLTITVNDKTSNEGSCDVYLQANKVTNTSYNYGSYTGILYASSTDNLSAGKDSRTITYGKVYRTKTPVYTWTTENTSNGTSTSEYYSGTLYITNSVNTGVNYITCSANATNSVSTTSTTTLTKSTYGTDLVDSQTYTISMRLGSSTGNIVKSITLKTIANAETSITYGVPSISLSYAEKDASFGLAKPSISYSQTRILNYTSGGTLSLSNLTSGATISYSETTDNSDSTVSSLTGNVTWLANETSNSRSCKITAEVTMNGKTGSKTVSSVQLADEISNTSTEYVISFSASSNTISAAGGTITLSYSGTATTTETWVSGNITTSRSSFTPNISGSAEDFNRSGTTVKVSPNESTVSRSVTYTASYSGATSKTVTITLDGDTIESTSYDYRVVLNASDYTSSSSACSSDGGSTTLSYTIYRTEVKHWVSGDTTYGTESTYNATPSFSGSATGFSRNGTTITISKNTNSSSRSCTYTASYGGASDSVTIYQEGFTDYIIEYGVPTVSIGDGMTAAGGSATVTASVMDTYASGAKKPGTVTLEIITNGNLRFSLSGNTLSHDNMGTSTIPDLVTIAAFNANSTNKQATDTVTITNDIISTGVNSISITEFSYDNLEPLINQSASPDLTVYANIFDIYASGSQGNSYDKEITSGYDTTYRISDSTYFRIDSSGTCTTKYSNNENTDRLATVSVLVLYGGKTATASTTITLLATKYVTLTIRRSNYDGDWALFDSSTPLTDKSIYYILQNSTGTFTYMPGEGIQVNNESGSRTTVSVPGTVYVWDLDLYNIWTFAGEVYVDGTNLSININ